MRNAVTYISLGILLLVLIILTLSTGAVDIPFSDVIRSIFGEEIKTSWRYIIIESRLPMTVTAITAGAGLSVSGLLMQTTFRNPLAGPSLLGVSSGASLGVAIVSMAGVSWLYSGSVMDTLGSLGIGVIGAVLGAMAVIFLLTAFSSLVRSALTLLIVGIMLSYLCSSVISLLNFFAPADDVKSFAVWGMGSYMGVTTDFMLWLSGTVILLLIITMFMAKPLDALMLGERYAANLGCSVKRIRTGLLILSGLLTAVITAFCGPIGFIGLVVPHLARLLFRTSSHFQLLPGSMLIGIVVSLFCAWITVLPSGFGILPINAVTPLVGVPVILYLLIAGKRLAYFN